MGFMDKAAELAKSMFTLDFQMKTIESDLEKVNEQMHILQIENRDLSERVARLEEQRQADRAQMQTEIERFKLEVERAELRFRRQLPEA